MKEITYGQLKEWISSGKDFTLVDVREPIEHAQFNIGGDLIPLDEVISRSGEIPVDQPVVFYCKRGIRSQIAIQKLTRQKPGADFYNLTGGILNIKVK